MAMNTLHSLNRAFRQSCFITRTNFIKLTGISGDKTIELLKRFLEEEIIRKYGSGKASVYLQIPQ